MRIGDWFLTHSGRQFYPLDARPDDVEISDIAHALSQICRFGGHTLKFYSVAQHSVFVSRLVDPSLALIALMHDATEAFVGDMVRPLKYSLPAYVEVEERLWKVVAQRFNLPAVIPKEVKDADNIALQTERRDLLIHTDYQWSLDRMGVKAHRTQMLALQPAEAELLFMSRFDELNAL